jgi:hypothetical protein
VFCHQCGFALLEDMRYCPFCGTLRHGTPAAPSTSSTPAHVAAPDERVVEGLAPPDPSTPGLTWRVFLERVALGSAAYAGVLYWVGTIRYGDAYAWPLAVYSLLMALIATGVFAIVFFVLLAFKGFNISRGAGILDFLSLIYVFLAIVQIIKYPAFTA